MYSALGLNMEDLAACISHALFVLSADWNSSTPEGETYEIIMQFFTSKEISLVKSTIDGPLLRGVIFMPSDDAIVSFLNSSAFAGK